jgi:hypothetical protein
VSDDTPQIPTDAPAPSAATRVDGSPPPEPKPATGMPGGELTQEHPELLVAGAFAGAFLLAKILRRIGGT